MASKDTFSSVTASYERWRGRRIQLVEEDLAAKHARFAESPFILLRGSHYRFFGQFEQLLPDLARAPTAIVAGDLHVENFGTWRDRDARLVWGVFDFDEIDLLPYTIDLVRLATSTLLAIEAGHLTVDPGEACLAIHEGWRERLDERRPCPFVLGERHAHLYRLASEATVDPVKFERNILSLPAFERALPKPAARMLAQVTPGEDFRPQLRRRVAGVGSLGARRIVAFGELDGGIVVREAKQIAGPVSMWAQPKRSQVSGLPGAIDAARGVSADPWHRQSRKWVLRPLAPDATQLDLTQLRRKHDARKLLHSMGQEAANIHLVASPGAAAAKALRRDDAARPSDWLLPAAETMAGAIKRDYAEWCGSPGSA